MANLTIHNIVDAGTAPTFAAGATSMTVEVGNGHNTFLVVKNGAGSDVTLGVAVAGKTSYGVSNPAVGLTVTASGECWFPLRKEHADPDTPGVATVTLLPNATSVTVSLVRLS